MLSDLTLEQQINYFYDESRFAPFNEDALNVKINKKTYKTTMGVIKYLSIKPEVNVGDDMYILSWKTNNGPITLNITQKDIYSTYQDKKEILDLSTISGFMSKVKMLTYKTNCDNLNTDSGD